MDTRGDYMEGAVDDGHSPGWFGLNYQTKLIWNCLTLTYCYYVPGNHVNLLPPGLTKVLITLLLATDGADTVDSAGVGRAGEDHAGGGDVGPTICQSKKKSF